MAQAIATLSERKSGRIGIVSRTSAAACTASGTPAEFAAEQEDVVAAEPVVEIGRRRRVVNRTRRSRAPAPPGLERVPGDVPGQVDLVEIVHAGAAEGAVGDRKAGRLDQVRLDPEAGGEPQDRAGILRDVGLVEGDAHGAGVHGEPDRSRIGARRKLATGFADEDMRRLRN